MQTTLPAEWAPQAAILLTWPREDGDFASSYVQVEQNFIEIARTISRYQPVWINCDDEPQILERRLHDAGIPAERLKLFPVASDDVWARDHGPITVLRGDELLHLDFTFNGWGGKFESRQDNRITRNLAELGVLPYPVERMNLVLEGGAIDSDGEGTLLTTEQCLLTPTRNPALDKTEIELELKMAFGLKRVLWLKHGALAGDDTDSHVDTLARFCNPGTIAYQACNDRNDHHFQDLKIMEAELAALRRLDGAPYELVPLPLPRPITDTHGKRLPASYANFLIINGAVLVPTYGDPADDAALDALRPCFPDRKIIGIDCQALITQYGSLHCVTMQIPQAIE